ncbi:MAG TPA: hypothetical protein VJB65_02910, partial [Patescibacteria group bacterium]|nr:hypothetical protein [Patescibacteria group bacterium]
MKTHISENQLFERAYPQQSHYIQRIMQSQRMHHAYCIAGIEEGGERCCIEWWAQQLLCTQTQSPCTTCKSCTEYQKNIHPDILWITVKDTFNTESIGLSDMYTLKQFISSPPRVARYKVICIDKAEQMTLSVINSLLKTIEEPPSYIRILISTCHIELLPKTLQSRLHILFLPQLSEKIIVEILANHEIVNVQEQSSLLPYIQGKFDRLELIIHKKMQSFNSWKEETAFWINCILSPIGKRDQLIRERFLQPPQSTQ